MFVIAGVVPLVIVTLNADAAMPRESSGETSRPAFEEWAAAD